MGDRHSTSSAPLRLFFLPWPRPLMSVASRRVNLHPTSLSLAATERTTLDRCGRQQQDLHWTGRQMAPLSRVTRKNKPLDQMARLVPVLRRHQQAPSKMPRRPFFPQRPGDAIRGQPPRQRQSFCGCPLLLLLRMRIDSCQSLHQNGNDRCQNGGDPAAQRRGLVVPKDQVPNSRQHRVNDPRCGEGG
ncbi:hypothetical protein CA51_22480 [Rosistilla oblonga]|nr:hypothetical protein CA51_22480 [Rosistilla oblonga]